MERFHHAAHTRKKTVGSIREHEKGIVPAAARNGDAHQIVATQPTADDHLFCDRKDDLFGRDTGVGRAVLIVEVSGVNIHQTRQELGPISRRLDIATNVQAIRGEHRLIAQSGIDDAGLAGGFDRGRIFDVTKGHFIGSSPSRERGVADRNCGKSVGQSGKVPHGKIQAAIGASG